MSFSNHCWKIVDQHKKLVSLLPLVEQRWQPQHTAAETTAAADDDAQVCIAWRCCCWWTHYARISGRPRND